MAIMRKIDELKPASIFKVSGIALIVIVFLFILVNLITGVFRQQYDYGAGGGYGGGMMESPMAYDTTYDQKLSARNIMPESDFSTGDTAEQFEVKEYYANIETHNKDKACPIVASLKARDYVIFESSNEYEHGCNYNFKVKKESVDEILAIIKDLDPKDLNENIFTIQQAVEDYTSRIEALNKKKASIEETLDNAIKAYDEISELAKSTQNAESLAKIIDSKIGIIERLTQEKMNINEQLDSIERMKTVELDRLNFVYFRVSIWENKYIDWQVIRDSWKSSVQQFVSDINSVFQNLSINLASFFLKGVQVAVYFFILLFVVKYGWAFAKRIWKQ